jgi:hypothetical protein
MAVVCSHCYEEIEHQSDLIVTGGLFTYNAYHAQCYGLSIKRGFSLGGPINVKSWIALPIILFCTYLFYLQSPLFRREPILHLIMLLPILVSLFQRVYSFFKFEKKLK